MSHPFILWTLQRTGGTALASRLMALSEHPSVEHEPFNWSRDRPRPYWPVVATWLESGGDAALADALDAITARQTLIKHCYDLVPMALNLALLDAAKRAGYRHVLLERVNHGARLLSKFVAEAQGTWFADHARQVYAEVEAGTRSLRPVPVDLAVAQFRHARRATEALRAAFAARDLPFAEATFEALYGADRTGRARAYAALLEHLDLAPGREASEVVQWVEVAKDGERPISAVLGAIPNIDAVVQGLAAAGCSVPPGLGTRGLVGALVAQLALRTRERGWIVEDDLDERWPGVSIRFDPATSLAFRIESADATFGNVYFGLRNREAVPNKSLDEALTAALGLATTSDTWPWCRHPDLEDDLLPVEADWGAGETLSRGVADGSLASRVLAAADRFRTALVGSGYLVTDAAEDAGADRLAGMAEGSSPSRALFAAGYLAGLGLAAETILDVGVGEGTRPLYEAFPDRGFVLIDPQWGGETTLTFKPRAYRYVGKAAGRADGRASLSADGAKSTLLERTALTAGGDVKRYDVEVTTLDAIIDALGVGGSLGVKIDTEGYESEVMAGLVRHRDRVEWVICEVSIRARFVAGYGFSDFVAAMREAGFLFYNVLSAIEPRPLFYDVLFLKAGHRLFG